MLNFKLCLFLCLFFVGCQPNSARLGPGDQNSLATPLQASCGYLLSASTGGHRISWKNRLPIQIEISSIPEDFKSAVYQAASTWNSETKINLFEVSESPTVYPQSRGDQKNSIHWVTPWKSAAHFQALTYTKYTGDLLQEADIIINGQNFQFISSDALEEDQYHLHSLLVHEMGHVLGLQHSKTASVMWPNLASQVIRTQITPEDLKNIYCEYSK